MKRILLLTAILAVFFVTSCGETFQKPCVVNHTGDIEFVDTEYPDLGNMEYYIEWSNGSESSGTFASYNGGVQGFINKPAGQTYALYGWEWYDYDFTRWIIWGEGTFTVKQCEEWVVYAEAQYYQLGRIAPSEYPETMDIIGGGIIKASDYGDGTILEIIANLKK